MKILVCTDGSHAAEQAAQLVSQLGLPREVEYTFLGVVETQDSSEMLDASFDRMSTKLRGTTPNISRLFRQGDSTEQILLEASEHSYDLVVLGVGGEHHDLLRFKVGSTTGKLSRILHTHFLAARNVPERIGKVLFCTGAEASTIETMRIGGQMLAGLQADATVLHVMSRITLKEGNIPEKLVAGAETAIARNTREGQHLRWAIQQLTEAGFRSPITPCLRHGLVVTEVLGEVREGEYDLLVVGAHYQPGQNRWLGMLLDDVTDQLLNQAPCSVLII